MAIDLQSFSKLQDTLERDKHAQEAASAGLKSLEKLIHILSQQVHDQDQDKEKHPEKEEEENKEEEEEDDADVADEEEEESEANIMLRTEDCVEATISEFKKVVSLLTRSGHARFRRGIGQNKKVSLASLQETPLMEASQMILYTHDQNRASSSSPSFSSSSSSSTSSSSSLPSSPLLAFHNQPPPLLPPPPPPPNVAMDCSTFSLESSKDKELAIPLIAMAYAGDMMESIPSATIDAVSASFYGAISHQHMLYNHNIGHHNSGLLLATNTTKTTPTTSDKLYIQGSLNNNNTSSSLILSSLSIGGNATKNEVLNQNSGRPPSKKRSSPSNRRKSRSKRVIRVPAISSKMSDIPRDGYSWRKYGQKPIKGSPHPRNYYRCSSVKGGCPAKKHVERALDDSNMLIVTYDAEHNHSQTSNEDTNILVPC